MIGMHPQGGAGLSQAAARSCGDEIETRIAGYPDPRTFYVEKLTEGIATLGAAFAPKPVIVRLSDFKSNEYSSLIGGQRYEPHEENPMLGFRGASRYHRPSFPRLLRAGVPRAEEGARRDGADQRRNHGAVRAHRERGQRRSSSCWRPTVWSAGENGLRVIMMCEIPSNALLADQFLEHFDGFSIGSNDMTQLTLGVDRDSGIVAGSFDERDPAVKAMLHMAIQACRKAGKYVGICGQGPSDHPDLAEWLVEEGIDTISLNPGHGGRDLAVSGARSEVCRPCVVH